MRPLTPALEQNGWLELIKEQVESLRFGVVQVVVHESRVVQIEKTEKFRLEASGNVPTPKQQT